MNSLTPPAYRRQLAALMLLAPGSDDHVVERTLNIYEAARYLHVSDSVLTRMDRRGEMPPRADRRGWTTAQLARRSDGTLRNAPRRREPLPQTRANASRFNMPRSPAPPRPREPRQRPTVNLQQQMLAGEAAAAALGLTKGQLAVYQRAGHMPRSAEPMTWSREQLNQLMSQKPNLRAEAVALHHAEASSQLAEPIIERSSEALAELTQRPRARQALRCRMGRHRFTPFAVGEHVSAQGQATLVEGQRCACGAERRVLKKPFGPFIRTVAIQRTVPGTWASDLVLKFPDEEPIHKA